MRTTSTQVQAILAPGRDYRSGDDLSPFMEAATAIVDRVNTCATESGITLSSTELELVERWLSAHFYVSSNQTFASKKTGSAAATYQGQTGTGFKSSKYGQAAINLDASGCLLKLDADAVQVGAYWLGKPPSEQTDYSERD